MLDTASLVDMVASSRGERLRAMLDAAQDVAESSPNPGLRAIARTVLSAGRQWHPEYFDPTLPRR